VTQRLTAATWLDTALLYRGEIARYRGLGGRSEAVEFRILVELELIVTRSARSRDCNTRVSLSTASESAAEPAITGRDGVDDFLVCPVRS
jgi:hypothetical protein